MTEQEINDYLEKIETGIERTKAVFDEGFECCMKLHDGDVLRSIANFSLAQAHAMIDLVCDAIGVKRPEGLKLENAKQIIAHTPQVYAIVAFTTGGAFTEKAKKKHDMDVLDEASNITAKETEVKDG